jgi:RHS repeat-associated protein
MRGSTQLYQLTISSRDNNGRIQSMSETINGGAPVNWTLGYDSNGRLQTATRGSVSNTYTYDPNGNRIALNGTTWTYDAQDRFLSAGTTITSTYTNDGTGLSKTVSGLGTYGYTYDLSGVLRSISLPADIGSNYSINTNIDGLNRRIGRTTIWGSTDKSQYFLYDEQNRVVAETSASGATGVTSIFVYGTKANVPDYMYQPNASPPAAYRIISDWAGSVRLVVNVATGAIAERLDYDEFGNILSTSTDANNCLMTNPSTQCFPFQPLGFAGGLRDRDTGLVRFGARDYDPQLGRWTSKDPIRFDGGQTNLYVYSGDDPINEIDPTGRDAAPICGSPPTPPTPPPPPPPPPPIPAVCEYPCDLGEGQAACVSCCFFFNFPEASLCETECCQPYR